MNQTDNQAPDPAQGGRYERNADGSLKTIGQTAPADPADVAKRKAEAQAKKDAEGGAAPVDNEQE